MNSGMYGAKKAFVDLKCQESMLGILFDRFGTGIPIKPAGDDGWVETQVEVMVSDHFISWIFALGDGIKITGPKRVTDQVDAMIERLNHTYR